jgi:hydrogenase maturation protease
MSTVIIGIGNPLRRDDGVGLRVAGELRERGANVVELCAGGLRVMEAMAGYDRAFVIDAIESGGPPGWIHRLSAADLAETRNTGSTHDGSLSAALETGREAGLRLPADIRIWAVEAADVDSFGDSLTPAVEASARVVADSVWRELNE